MNRVYSLVWNRALHSVQVASELATSAGGGNSAGVSRAVDARRRHPLALACLAALALGAFGLPAWSVTCTINGVTYTDCVQGVDGGVGSVPTGGTGGVSGNAGGAGAVVTPSGAQYASGQNGEGVGAGAGGGLGGTANGGSGGAGGGMGGSVGGAGSAGAGGGGGGIGSYGIGGGGGGGAAYTTGSSVYGGGGGGGGALGATVTTSATYLTTHAVVGGNGGNGGDYKFAGSGGGGGAFGGGGGGGGAGVLVEAGVLTNQGLIAGGVGGVGGNSKTNQGNGTVYANGGGGAGVLLTAGTTLINAGVVRGGNGGGDAFSNAYSGGGGGGVAGKQFTLLNSGTITGGARGETGLFGGYGSGGTGVSSSGNAAITNAGAISGSNGADAIDLSGGGNTLTLEVGSTFTGNIVSTSGANNGGDTLTLGDDTLGSNPSAGGNATLAINAVSGFAQHAKTGTSTWTLTGANGDTGLWDVKAGTLIVGTATATASLAGPVTVEGGATLGGYGSVGATTVAGGTLAPGSATKLGTAGTFGTLTINGDLSLQGGSSIDLNLGAPGATSAGDHINVTGGLTMSGTTLNVGNINNDIGPGLYNVITYASGPTVNSGLSVATAAPAGQNYSIQYTAGQVNLIDAFNTLAYWSTTAGSFGGTGTWTAASKTWTDSTGTAPLAAMSPVPGFAEFQGTAGTVTVDSSAAPIQVTGMQFFVPGYSVVGRTASDAITLVQDSSGGVPVINVGDGTSASSTTSATISAVLAGTDGLTKTDYGTLVLTGDNTYTGDTTVNQGTLEVASAGTLGTSTVTVNGAAGVNSTLTVDSGATLANHIVLNSSATAAGDCGGISLACATFDNAGTLNGTADHVTVGSNGGYVVVNNSGAINGNLYAVKLSRGGSVTNAATASITAGDVGAEIDGAVGSVSNTGSIYGTVVGVELGAGGTIHNAAAGTMSSSNVGAYLAAGGAVANSGAITATHSAVGVNGGAGDISNTNGGVIRGSDAGIYLLQGGSVSNDATSTIEATGTARGDCATAGDCAIFAASASDGAGMGGALTLSNAGKIIGNVQMDPTAANATTLTAGGSIAGDLDIGTNAMSTLTLDGDAGTSQLYSQAVTGATTFAGALTKSGTGTWIVDSDDLSTVSGTTIDAGGTLQVGSGGNTGSIGDGNITDNGALVFDRSNAQVFAGAISGTGTLAQQGGGTLTLDGANTYAGLTEVNAGTLLVGDATHATASIVGDTRVDNGATLGGFGTVGAADATTEIQSGGVLSPGAGTGSIGTLGIGGDLTLDQGSVLDYDLGAPGTPNAFTNPGGGDSVNVAGTLTFNGGSTLDLAAAGSPGLYNLASYGALATSGCSFSDGTACVTLGTLPNGTQASNYTIVNNTQANQIDLYNTAGQALNIWAPNGAESLGGSGTWSATSATWTNTNGDGPSPMTPSPGFAIFQGTSGTVTVDDSAGEPAVTGVQFAVDGYTLTGGALNLVADSAGNAPVVEVGDGSGNSANMTAIIGSYLEGTDGFTKTGAGTLVLTQPLSTIGLAVASGSVGVQEGTLQIGSTSAQSAVDVAAIKNPLTMAQGTRLVLDSGVVAPAPLANGASIAAVQGQGFTIETSTTGNGTVSGIVGSVFPGSTMGAGAGSAIAGSAFTATFTGNTFVAGSPGGSILSAVGAAAITGANFTVSNANASGSYGSIRFGITGGVGTYSTSGTGGTGGAGIAGSGFTVSNSGDISGGAGGGTSTGTAGFGGAGVSSTGGSTVINEGTISGGLSGDGSAQADAIDFTGGGNTLELVAGHPGTFNGAIVVTRAAGDPVDTLELGGDSGSDTFDLSRLASNGELSGFNAEAKSGDSTWTLTGAGATSESWTVVGGTLAGDATALQGDITFAPGTSSAAPGVVFNQGSGNANSTPDGTFAGVISGAGAFTKTGDGTLTLTGANTFSGSTTISAGTLQIGNGGTSGTLGTGAVVDNGTLVFDRSDAVLLPAGLTGSGNLVQQGSGTFTINGDDSGFAGTTAINAGALVVGDDSHANASLGGMVHVAQGATLSGIGTLGGLDLSGALNPGGSIGTLHVTGDATFEAGSTFNVEAAPDGTGDQLAVGGTTTIKGGSVMALTQPGNWAPSTTYTIITSGHGISGTFSGVSDDQAFLTPTLAYGAHDVTLTLARNDVTFPDVAVTPNERGVAGGIEGQGPGSDLYDAVVKLSTNGARDAFNQTSGEYHASQQAARIDDSRFIREAMNQRLRNGDADREAARQGNSNVTAWAHAWGHWGTLDGDGNAAKLSDNGDGLLIGADMPVGARARIGITGGASRDSLSVRDRASWGKLTSQWLGAFAGYDAGAFGIRGGIAYAWDQVPGNREVNFPGYTDRLSGNATGDTLTGFIEGSWTFRFQNASLSPFLNLAHTKVATDASTEAGGAAALHAYSGSENVSFSTLGARGEVTFADHLNVHGELGWQHAFGDTTPERSMQFATGGPVFTAYGVPIAKNAGLGRIGIGWQRGNVAVSADYEGLSGGGVKDQAAKLSVNVTF